MCSQDLAKVLAAKLVFTINHSGSIRKVMSMGANLSKATNYPTAQGVKEPLLGGKKGGDLANMA